MLFSAEETPEGQTEEIKRRRRKEKKWKQKQKGFLWGMVMDSRRTGGVDGGMKGGSAGEPGRG